MESAKKERSLEKKTRSGQDSHLGATPEAASQFTDDLILEILSRLPARSLHRFKCVSLHWRDLITDPANRKMLPQTLAGFLYTSYSSGRRHHFASVSGSAAPFDPSLPCLQPNKYKDMAQVDSCNGLLLYRACTDNKLAHGNWTEDDICFVVCNPVTGRLVELPPQPWPQFSPANGHSCTLGLAFDPAVSSHFHVIYFEENYLASYMTGVSIYSSLTGAWSRRDSVMAEKVGLLCRDTCVFVGGMLYVIGNLKNFNNNNNGYVLVGVDVEGRVWKTIPVPYSLRVGTIGSSQGCLHYATASFDDNNEIIVSEIALWCLQDHDSKELVLKHTANIVKLMNMTGKKYMVVEIHPDCDTIFLISSGRDTLVAYDMRHRKVGRIINLEETKTYWQRFLPYVPLFSESLADADEQ